MILLKNLHELLTLKPVTAEAAGRPRAGTEMQELAILHNAAVVIDGAQIAAVGDTVSIARNYEKDCRQAYDGAGVEAVYMPGFVDSHTHPIFAATRENEYEMRCLGRSYQEIAAAGGGIRSSMQRVRAATEEELYERSQALEAVFLSHGTTTVEAKSGYGLRTQDELKILRVIARLRAQGTIEWAPTFLGAHAIPPEFDGRSDAYTELVVREMLPLVAQEKLAEFCDVFCEENYFSAAQSQAILAAARGLGLKLKIHAEEFSYQGGAELAAELGAVSADHLEHISDAGISALRASGTVATLLPGTAFNLGLRQYPPARKLIDAGVPVALATDFNPGSTHSPNMQLMIAMACAQMRMTPAEAITAATINGAWAVARGNRLGSLEPGKQADIIGLAVENFRKIPYYYGVNHCRFTIKRGVVWRNELLRQLR